MDFDNEIKCISLDGFQLVKSKYFSRSSEPMMSLFPSAISFNVSSHEALNGCESVEILVNGTNKSIIVRPAVKGKENEAIKWRRNTSKPQYSRVECTMFAKKIYAAWGLSDKFSYKTMGKLVQCDKKVMLLFDFSEKEAWEGSKLVKENG